MIKSIFFALGLSFFLFGCTKPPVTPAPEASLAPAVSPEAVVPLPTAEDSIRLFYSLINEHKIPEAIAMMSQSLVPDESSQQAWGVQFNDFKSVKVLEISPGLSPSSYQVVLEVTVDPQAASLPIPFYGYDANPNYRWLDLIKIDGRWLINSINTGP